MILTGRREREFVFYVTSPAEFLKALGQMPQEVERYPIEIYEADDPDWAYYENESNSAG